MLVAEVLDERRRNALDVPVLVALALFRLALLLVVQVRRYHVGGHQLVDARLTSLTCGRSCSSRSACAMRFFA